MLKQTWSGLTQNLLLLLVLGCASHQARQAIESRQKEFALNNEAWQAARIRLGAMCPNRPATIEQYKQAHEIIRLGGRDPFQGCNVRIVKVTNSPVTNDWQWFWAPPYQTIVAVHEEEMRKRVTPKPYEEYMLGLSRYLGKAADDGAISPQQLVQAFNAGWTYMVNAMKNEAVILTNDLKAAELSDAQTWKTIGEVAVGLAAVATTALVVAASARSASPAPAPSAAPAYVYVPSPAPSPPRTIHCQARQPAYTVYIDCYGR
jgi:hypothetical protein